MLPDQGKQDRRPAHGHRTSKGRKPSLSHGIFVPLFGFRPRPATDVRVKDRDKDRDRSDSRRDRDHGRSGRDDRNRDQTRDRDRNRHRRQPSPLQERPRHSPAPSSTRRRPPSPSRRIHVQLKSLGHRYIDFTFPVKPGTPVMKLEHQIRRQYRQERRPLDHTALFRFYASDAKEYQQQDVIEVKCPPIWYSVSKFAGEVEGWKFTHYQDNTHGRLDSWLARELERAISDGATVGQLRRKIADHFRIEDAYRIVLVAKGGMRPGSLKGENWIVQQVKDKWLCRWIAIDVNPEKRYVILKGLRREYIFHPDPTYFRPSLHIEALKSDMVKKLFQAARQGGKSEVRLGWRQVNLTSREGKAVGDRDVFRWGSELNFEITVDAAEVFSAEESWLLRATETCMICVEDKKVTELPVRITADCKHQTTSTCKDCVKTWLQSSLESGTWDRLKCPECPSLLKHQDVKRYASPEVFSRYDDLAVRAHLSKEIPNFRWCLSPTCDSGQIDDEKCPKFKCSACAARHCTAHNVPWHKGETCDEYDKRHRRRLKDDKASEAMIKKTSKDCPQCGKAVHKYMGCNHITCVCGHEWCYVCLARFERNHVDFLFCRHKPDCTERDPFIDLIDNPPPRPLFAAGGNHNNNNNNNRRFQVPPPGRPAARNGGAWFPPPLRANPGRVAGAGTGAQRQPPPAPWGGPGFGPGIGGGGDGGGGVTRPGFPPPPRPQTRVHPMQ